MAKQVPERSSKPAEGKPSARKAAVADNPRRQKLWRDLALIAVAPLLLYLLASLLTYSATDPGWSRTGNLVAPIHNMGGRYGAMAADCCSCGYVAFLLPVLLGRSPGSP